jgi:uncharacterized protein YcfJ
MKNVLAAAIVALMPLAATAGGLTDNYAVITAVHPIYQENHVTVYQEVCRHVEVPVYSNERASSGDVLLGAIVGGAIGNQFGGGSGKDAMTVLGAIVGANRVASNGSRSVVGYRVEEHCESIPTRRNEPVISHYRIQYTYNGYTYSQETTRRYTLGQRVMVEPSLR